MAARMPAIGEVLVHRFRRREGEVRAEVIGIDLERRSVKVRMDGEEYGSLSAAAKAVSGSDQNGWVYWGLKKQPVRVRSSRE